MPRNLILLPEAQDDLQNPLDWYFQQEPGLDERFLSRIDKIFLIISEHPDRFPIRFGGRFRRALMHRFPYAVYYKYDEKTVYISAVFHGAQSPARLRGRLK